MCVIVGSPKARKDAPKRRFGAARSLPYRASLLIFLDDAVAACSFQRFAHPRRFFHGWKRTNHGPVIDAPHAKANATHDRLAPTKLVGEFGSEHPIGRMGCGRAACGSHLNRVAAGRYIASTYHGRPRMRTRRHCPFRVILSDRRRRPSARWLAVRRECSVRGTIPFPQPTWDHNRLDILRLRGSRYWHRS